MRRSLVLGLTLSIAMTAFATSSGTASARDEHPCGEPYQHNGITVQDCPLWTGRVPVLKDPAQGSQVVGYLHQGGTANWFDCQATGDTEYHLGKLFNIWYGYTKADNGRWGWVPEVYFSGGENDEMDANLAQCPPRD